MTDYNSSYDQNSS